MTTAPEPKTVASGDDVRALAPTGVLRASINLGNPVLAQGSTEAPRGVTVDIAHTLGARLGVTVELLCFDAARDSYEAMRRGDADLCFLAIEPAREAEVAFTEPYVLIEGVYVVPDGSPLATTDDVDRPGVRIGVKTGSAYDLFLTRTLERATLVRGAEGVEVFLAEGLEVGAGIREPVTAFAARTGGVRVLDDAFMQIRQAVGVPRSCPTHAVAFLRAFVEELKACGFVADMLERSGQRREAAAPPA